MEPYELLEAFDGLQPYDLLLLVGGLAILLMAFLPRLLHDKPVTAPMALVVIGYAAFALPLGLEPPDPIEQGAEVEQLTEIGVIISLMVVGLSIDRRMSLRNWSVTWRLLAITMPLTIAAAAVAGWWIAGLVPASAALFGAVISPTDPVLGKDVEVGAPGEGAEDRETEEHDPTGPGEEDEVRFALTSEAGLNDGLAFPYTNMAIAMAIAGAAPGNWIVAWIGVDVVFKLGMAIVCGIVIGKILAQVLLRLPARTQLAKAITGLGALAATLIIYGATEYVGGYGFIATFVGAVTIRHHDRYHEYQQHLQSLVEMAERLLMAVIMLGLGGAVAGGLLAALNWQLIIVALLVVFVIRPVTGVVGLIGFGAAPWRDRMAISFFGIRGIGTFYYLSHGLEEADFAFAEEIWALAALVVLLSVFVHGLLGAPMLDKLDWMRQRNK